jgi:hypothetical protein
MEHKYEIHTDEMCPYIEKRRGDSGLRIVTGLINNTHETVQWPYVRVIALKKKLKLPFASTWDLNYKEECSKVMRLLHSFCCVETGHLVK